MSLNRLGYSGLLNVMLVPIAGSSEYKAVGSVSAPVNDTALDATGIYVFTANVDCYIKQGAAPIASAADGSQLVPAGMPVLIDGAEGAFLSAIQGPAAGDATIQKMKALS